MVQIPSGSSAEHTSGTVDSGRLNRTISYLSDVSPDPINATETKREFSFPFLNEVLTEPELTHHESLQSSSMGNTVSPSHNDNHTTRIVVEPKDYERKRVTDFSSVLVPDLIEALPLAVKGSLPIVPTDVQSYAFPFLKEFTSVLIRSPTGSGKTLAFLLPIISNAVERKNADLHRPFALLICDTRDLSVQHHDVASKLCTQLDVNTGLFLGGDGGRTLSSDLTPQERREGTLSRDIVCISPGKMGEFIHKGMLDLRALRYLIFDEADEFFLECKFQAERKILYDKIIELRESGVQFSPCVAMFSATLIPEHRDIVEALDATVDHEHRQNIGLVIVETQIKVEQRVLKVDNVFVKLRILVQLMDRELKKNGASREDESQYEKKFNSTTIIFADTRKTVYMLAAYLTAEGFFVKPQTGDVPQGLKQRNLDYLKAGKLPFLVTTNALARGMDVDNIKHVIMYELPRESWSSYTHRVGRTGRAGESGVATVLFDMSRKDDRDKGPALLKSLEVFNQVIPKFLYDEYGHSLNDAEEGGLPTQYGHSQVVSHSQFYAVDSTEEVGEHEYDSDDSSAVEMIMEDDDVVPPQLEWNSSRETPTNHNGRSTCYTYVTDRETDTDYDGVTGAGRVRDESDTELEF